MFGSLITFICNKKHTQDPGLMYIKIEVQRKDSHQQVMWHATTRTTSSHL